LQKLKKQLKKSNLAEIAEEFDKLKQELEAKDAQIVAEKQEQEKIIERSVEIIKVQTVQKDKRIETLESDIVQKDKQIETLKSKNKQNLKQINRTVSQLNDSTKLMRTLKNDLKAKDEQIIELREKVAKNSNSVNYATKFVKNSDEVIDKALKEAFIADKLKAQVKVTKTNNARGDVAILKNFDEESIFADPEISSNSKYKQVVEKAINRTVSAITKKVESFVKALEHTYNQISLLSSMTFKNEDDVKKHLLKNFKKEEENRIEYEREKKMQQQEQSRNRDDDNDFYMMR
jgi:small-conductance mechanosensitive channel